MTGQELDAKALVAIARQRLKPRLAVARAFLHLPTGCGFGMGRAAGQQSCQEQPPAKNGSEPEKILRLHPFKNPLDKREQKEYKQEQLPEDVVFSAVLSKVVSRRVRRISRRETGFSDDTPIFSLFRNAFPEKPASTFSSVALYFLLRNAFPEKPVPTFSSVALE